MRIAQCLIQGLTVTAMQRLMVSRNQESPLCSFIAGKCELTVTAMQRQMVSGNQESLLCSSVAKECELTFTAMMVGVNGE